MASEKPTWKGSSLEIAIAAGGGAPGGPAGAALAAAIQSIVDAVRNESFGGQGLARLQNDRVAEAIEEAGRTIQAIQIGPASSNPRRDWFAVENDTLISSGSAIEILEGTLIAAANSFEKRKVKLLGKLWALLVYQPSVSNDAAVFLLKTAGELSYAQLAILATLTEMTIGPPDAESAKIDLVLASGPVIERLQDARNDVAFAGSSTLAHQVFDLIRRDILRQQRGSDVPSDIQKVRPWLCEPTLLGRRLYALTAMRTHIPVAVKKELARALQEHTASE